MTAHPLLDHGKAIGMLLLLLFSHSVVSDSCDPWTVVCQAPLSMGFLRQESWSGLPFPSSGDLSNPGMGLLLGRFFTTESAGKLVEASCTKFGTGCGKKSVCVCMCL